MHERDIIFYYIMGIRMKFSNIKIKNFRNFECIDIDLENRNIIFGLNDVGKSNFLSAFRYVFDREIRKNNFIDTDYFQKNTFNPIELIVTIAINEETEDVKKLRAKMKGAISSNDDKVYIKLVASYDSKEMVGIPSLLWGGNINHLEEMKYNKALYYEIDHIFNPIFIDSYVDMYNLFKKNTKKLLNLDAENEEDKEILDSINDIIDNLNDKIGLLSGIKKFEEDIAPEYQDFKEEEISISIKSEIAIKGLYSNLIPYIRQGVDERLYPTSGDGRKKILAYSIFSMLSLLTDENKINLFFIEEPENHLHRSMQLTLSKTLFVKSKFQYLFLTTHSPYILSEIDNVNLIRIYNKDKITSNSAIYKVPDDYKKLKKVLNENLVEALFCDNVLLVEGPSEKVLFSKIFGELMPNYESKGIYILPVNGFGFEPYFRLLDKLNINNVIKTDNDLRKIPKKNEYSVLGFNRINNWINNEEFKLPTNTVGGDSIECKIQLYNNNIEMLNLIRKKFGIYLSKCSLEEDLDEIIHDEMCGYLEEADGNPIDFLKKYKHKNMVLLSEKLTKEDCIKIYNSYNFECLKEVLEHVD